MRTLPVASVLLLGRESSRHILQLSLAHVSPPVSLSASAPVGEHPVDLDRNQSTFSDRALSSIVKRTHSGKTNPAASARDRPVAHNKQIGSGSTSHSGAQGQLEHVSSFQGFQPNPRAPRDGSHPSWVSPSNSEPSSPTSTTGSPRFFSAHASPELFPVAGGQSRLGQYHSGQSSQTPQRQSLYKFLGMPSPPPKPNAYTPADVFSSGIHTPTHPPQLVTPPPSPHRVDHSAVAAAATAALAPISGHPPPPDFANQPPTPAERKNIKIALAGGILGGISFGNIVTNQWMGFAHSSREDQWRDSVTAALAAKQGVNVSAAPSASS